MPTGPERIVLIRHAEKPTYAASGVDIDGVPDADSLTPRGWQRAGALVRYFCPVDSNNALWPHAIFATGVGDGSQSKRSQQTASPLAEFLRPLGVPFETGFLKDDYAAMAAAIHDCSGNILIVWEHKCLPSLLAEFTKDPADTECTWPDDCFDKLWILDRKGSVWEFSEAWQRLLPGDKEIAAQV